MEARSLFPLDELILITDNSAVAFSVEKGLSTNDRAGEWLAQVSDLLVGLKVILVVSADNPSDCCSRANFRDVGPRTIRLEKAIQAHWEGFRWHSELNPFKKAENENGMVHDMFLRHGLEAVHENELEYAEPEDEDRDKDIESSADNNSI